MLLRLYGFDHESCATAVRALVETGNVITNRPTVETGLAMLDAGGDFADGIMAQEGKWLGGEVFVSFDKKTVKRLTEQGKAARLP